MQCSGPLGDMTVPLIVAFLHFEYFRFLIVFLFSDLLTYLSLLFDAASWQSEAMHVR